MGKDPWEEIFKVAYVKFEMADLLYVFLYTSKRLFCLSPHFRYAYPILFIHVKVKMGGVYIKKQKWP